MPMPAEQPGPALTIGRLVVEVVQAPAHREAREVVVHTVTQMASPAVGGAVFHRGFGLAQG
jgi:hypothetical protein